MAEVEGLSIISYKNKRIISLDYTNVGKDKVKTVELIEKGADEYIKQGKDSALVLANVTNINFNMDILNSFKKSREKTKGYTKKEAVFGVKGLAKAGYNFVVGLTSRTTKVFDTEQEAKEWLVID
jgi:hypothetical protein